MRVVLQPAIGTVSAAPVDVGYEPLNYLNVISGGVAMVDVYMNTSGASRQILDL